MVQDTPTRTGSPTGPTTRLKSASGRVTDGYPSLLTERTGTREVADPARARGAGAIEGETAAAPWAMRRRIHGEQWAPFGHAGGRRCDRRRRMRLQGRSERRDRQRSRERGLFRGLGG